MLGIQKIEAAFSSDGSPEIPVGICYTDIFIDDHWEELTSRPWWYKFSPDLDHQFLCRREVSEKIDQDLCMILFSMILFNKKIEEY